MKGFFTVEVIISMLLIITASAWLFITYQKPNLNELYLKTMKIDLDEVCSRINCSNDSIAVSFIQRQTNLTSTIKRIQNLP